MGKSLTEITNEWSASVNETASNISDSINKPITEGINKLFGGASDGISDSGSYPKFKVDPVEFRSKLEIECPDFLKQCNITKIDFGSLFLNAEGEQAIAQATAITNDVINTINGAQQFISPAALESVQNLITFIITDLVNTLTTYVSQVFLKYISPDFAIGFTTDVAKGTLAYQTQYTKKPDEVLKEVCQELNVSFEDIKKKSEEEMQNSLIGKIDKGIADVTSWIKEKMDEIQPYTSKISEYMVYGPDYVCGEIAALYEKYLGMGISYVDTYLAQIDQLVAETADYLALTSGTFLANQINIAQEKAAKKLINQNNKATQVVKMKAMSLINKTVMNLLAMLGG